MSGHGGRGIGKDEEASAGSLTSALGRITGLGSGASSTPTTSPPLPAVSSTSSFSSHHHPPPSGSGFMSALRNLAGRSFASQRKVPGTIKQVRGAQYPPLYNPPGGSDPRTPSPRTVGAVLPKGENSSSLAPSSSDVEEGSGEREISSENSSESALVPSNSDSGGTTTTLPNTILSPAQSRLFKFRKLIDDPVLDLEALRKLAWSGVPNGVRPVTWMLLLGYLPANSDRRQAVLERKRNEYLGCIPTYYEVPDHERTEDEQGILRQIMVDVPRTNPDVPLFQHHMVQKLMQRILYIWALRHPASGYVQGINDLVTPFFVVFLSERVGGDANHVDLATVPKETLEEVEADCYWCMSRLMDSIHDHYTFAQPGIQRMVFKMKELVHRVDGPLYKHLEGQGLHFLQFAFRWMNCLLMREMSLRLVVRMFDTYLADIDQFAVFHVYVCAAFLCAWSGQLRELEFQDLVLFLQHLPTEKWGDSEVEMMMSQAFMWMELFESAQRHLQ